MFAVSHLHFIRLHAEIGQTFSEGNRKPHLKMAVPWVAKWQGASVFAILSSKYIQRCFPKGHKGGLGLSLDRSHFICTTRHSRDRGFSRFQLTEGRSSRLAHMRRISAPKQPRVFRPWGYTSLRASGTVTDAVSLEATRGRAVGATRGLAFERYTKEAETCPSIERKSFFALDSARPPTDP